MSEANRQKLEGVIRAKAPSAARRFLFSAICLFIFAFGLSAIPVQAQDDPEMAPPPVRTVTKEEKTKLNAITDLKNRTKLTLELMTARLEAAEHYNETADFEAMFREFGGFQGLLDDSLDFLKGRDPNSGKTLDSFKRLEIGLRDFTPRIEAIRRDLPLRYEDYVRTLLIYVRDARSRAMEPMFSDTVVPIKTN